MLLHRYSGQSELAVGVSNGTEVTTPVRATVGGSFRELVQLAGARLAEAEQARTATPVHLWPGFSCRSAPRVAPETTSCDLNLQFSDLDGELTGRLVFATDVLDPATARRAVEHLLRLLEGATADPDRPVAELPCSPPRRRAPSPR